MATAAEEQHLAIVGIRQHMYDSFAANQIGIAQAAEKRLTALEAMTPEEFRERYPEDDSAIA